MGITAIVVITVGSLTNPKIFMCPSHTHICMAAKQTTTEDILESLGMDRSAVEQSAVTVQRWKELKDNERPITDTVVLPNNERLHHFQMVQQTLELPFGDDETTEWVVTEIDEEKEQVTMKVPGPWEKTSVTFEELVEGNYEPMTFQPKISAEEAEGGVEIPEPVPMFGY